MLALLLTTWILVVAADEPSQECGFTEDDIRLVRETWAPFYKDIETNGVLLFKIMFEMYPDYENMFVKFKKEGASLFDNPDFQKHIKENVMGTLNELIVNLENDEKIKEILNRVATNHSKRNVKREHFLNLGKVILETVKRAEKEAYTPDKEKSWTKLITCSMEYMGSIAGD